jgi:hypothetical protein
MTKNTEKVHSYLNHSSFTRLSQRTNLWITYSMLGEGIRAAIMLGKGKSEGTMLGQVRLG